MQLKTCGDQPSFPMRQDLRQLHREFLDYSEFTRSLSPDTLRGYVGSFTMLMKCCPDLTPEMIDVPTMQEFFKWLQTRARKVGKNETTTGVKKSTVTTYWRKISKFFDWLKAKRIIAQNPLRSEEMQAPLVRYEDKKYLDKRNLERILDTMNFKIVWKNGFLRHRNLAIISIALNCGLRKGELLGLKLGDIDLDRNLITVRAETSKCRRSRLIPLNSRARQDLEAYLNDRRERPYMTSHLWVSDSRDSRLTAHGLKDVVTHVATRAGVSFHLHQLRHTFAVNFLVNSGQNSFKLQQLLGHRSIASTAIYTRCLPPDIMRADMECLADLDNAL